MWTITLILVACGLLAGTNAATCRGRCGDNVDSSKPCQCNSHCSSFGDCCSDYTDLCLSNPTCWGRCGDNVDSSKPCQCNSHCSSFGDCCSDYADLCLSDPGNPSPADPTTVAEIASLIWEKDVNRASASHVWVNYQGQVSSSNTHADNATHPLFSSVNEGALFSKLTYARFIALLDNYTPSTTVPESLTASQWREVDNFLDAILATDVMKETEKFLRNKGKVSGSFRDQLHGMWFELYKRTSRGEESSSGFEHVFVGETNSKGVTGFHNWIQFYQEEKYGPLDYKGYVSRSNPDLIRSQFSWVGSQWKQLGSFFIGTSPEFDMAIYTICFLMHKNGVCEFRLDGHKISIKTYDNSNWPGDQIGTAYPM